MDTVTCNQSVLSTVSRFPLKTCFGKRAPEYKSGFTVMNNIIGHVGGSVGGSVGISSSFMTDTVDIIEIEGDSLARECEVYFSTKETDFLKNDGFLRALLNSENNKSVHHWAVIFAFQGGRMILTDLSTDGEDEGQKKNAERLIVSRYGNVSSYGRRLYFNNSVYLGTLQLSPVQVKGYCDNHPHNGLSYDAVRQNCQHWVEHILVNCGFDVAHLKYVSQQLPLPVNEAKKWGKK